MSSNGKHNLKGYMTKEKMILTLELLMLALITVMNIQEMVQDQLLLP